MCLNCNDVGINLHEYENDIMNISSRETNEIRNQYVKIPL